MSWDWHEDEEWADVPGAEGRMWVSTHGRAYRHRTLRGPAGLMSPAMPNGAAKYVTLTVPYLPKGRTRPLHIVVAEAFRGPRPEGRSACHYDDDKTNNYLGNIYWGTAADNARDRQRNQRMIQPGPRDWFTTADLLARGWTPAVISRRLGADQVGEIKDADGRAALFDPEVVIAHESTPEFYRWWSNLLVDREWIDFRDRSVFTPRAAVHWLRILDDMALRDSQPRRDHWLASAAEWRAVMTAAGIDLGSPVPAPVWNPERQVAEYRRRHRSAKQRSIDTGTDELEESA